MLKEFKLRHLDMLMEGNVDIAILMVELNGYRNPRWRRMRAFKKSYSKTHHFIKQMIQMDPTLISINPECQIKVPKKIDHITFAAMMSIHALMSNPGDKTIGALMGELVAIACYSANYKGKFDVESNQFKKFENIINETPALDVIGLYNHVDDQLKRSQLYWEKQFLAVQIIDQDWNDAGGARMGAYNVLNTIKHLCADFNITDDEAWQKPYSITQTNSLEKATQGHIQHTMTKIKEHKMRVERNKKH